MPSPRKLWKTEIVIWSEWDPQKTEVSVLARAGESGSAYIGKAHSELVAGWREDPDAPSEDFFGVDDDELS
jgi:hypothetical protein